MEQQTLPLVEVNDVSMRFNLAQEKTETLKEYTVKLLKGKLMFNEFYALKNVSFTVSRGEAVALIGRNGSGKSTMLKVIAGVMYPSKGSCTVRGSIAPMIELGAGFDMDLTARENIYLNGAVLGFDRDYMNEHFESIIEFSELRDFIDVPVKNFSSGMIARLGFSIATAVKADLLVVDEAGPPGWITASSGRTPPRTRCAPPMSRPCRPARHKAANKTQERAFSASFLRFLLLFCKPAADGPPGIRRTYSVQILFQVSSNLFYTLFKIGAYDDDNEANGTETSGRPPYCLPDHARANARSGADNKQGHQRPSI